MGGAGGGSLALFGQKNVGERIANPRFWSARTVLGVKRWLCFENRALSVVRGSLQGDGGGVARLEIRSFRSAIARL